MRPSVKHTPYIRALLFLCSIVGCIAGMGYQQAYAAPPATAPSLNSGTNRDGVELSWSSVSGATQYEVYSDGVIIEDSTGNYFFYDVANGIDCETHNYTVKGKNADGLGPASNTITTAKDCTPEAPTLSGAGGSVPSVNWTIPDGTDHFRLMSNGNEQASNIPGNVGGGNLDEFQGDIQCDTPYDIYVIAVNSHGETASNIVTVTKDCSSAGGGGGMSKSDMQDLLSTYFALGIAVLVGLKVIDGFRYRSYD